MREREREKKAQHTELDTSQASDVRGIRGDDVAGLENHYLGPPSVCSSVFP